MRRSRFVAQVFRPDFGFTMRLRENEPTDVERRGADEEATLAVAITFRFFIYEKDGIEIGQIAELYESLPVSDEEKRRARAAADSVKDFLDSPLPMGINGQTFLRRRLLYVFLYGGLAHANADKREQYEKWTKGEIAPVMQCMFEETVAVILRVVVSFQGMNRRTIALLESCQSSATPLTL